MAMKQLMIRFSGILLLCVSAVIPVIAKTPKSSEMRTPKSSVMQAPGSGGDTLRILAIGNSFSEDALEQEFIPLCRAAGKNVIVGNLFIGGCSVSRHYGNLKTDKPDYRYCKFDTSGRCDTVPGDVLSRALLDEPWDIISFQQASHDSGKKQTYSELPAFIQDVRSRVGDHPRFVWHQTWAYSPDSSHGGFVYYGRNQQVMYDSICSAVDALVKANPQIVAVIPVGAVIQTARTTALGDDLTRDGYHLNRHIGRYIAAATWLKSLFGINPAEVDYLPIRVNPAQKAAADSAVMSTHTLWPHL